MALILLMGIPGSGKTTLCRKLNEQLGNDDACVTFSFDDIFNDDGFLEHLWGAEYANASMLRLYGLEPSGPSAHSERKRCESRVRDFLKTRLTNGSAPVTIVDDIFYLKSMRRPFQRMANLHHLPYAVILVDVPIAVALARNANRPSKCRIPESTIRKIHQQMELPRGNSNFFIYKSENDLKRLIEYIHHVKHETRLHDEPPAENLREQRRENENVNEKTVSNDEKWMKLEVNLRKCVSELIREKNIIGKNGAILAKLKKEFYMEMRTNDMVVIDDWTVPNLKNALWRKVQEEYQ